MAASTLTPIQRRNSQSLFLVTWLMALAVFFCMLGSPTQSFSGSVTSRHHSANGTDSLDDDDYEEGDDAAALVAHHKEVFALDLDALHGSHADHGEQAPLSIVCQLSGELANNLSKFAHAYALWRLLKQNYPQHDYKILLRHQDNKKWVRGQHDINLCFPLLRQFDFTEGNTDDFNNQLSEQNAQNWTTTLSDINVGTTEALAALANFSAIASSVARPDTGDSAIGLPFLYSNSFVGFFPEFISYADDYYDDYKRVFEFDTGSPECCALRADPDETVFHFRNFKAEMPRIAVKWGFEEMGPNQTAQDLLGHLQPGDKVAILSRFDLAHTQPFVDAMVRRGLQVRFVQGQTGVQDFCFLMSAQKELIGSGQSTYAFWAGMLGNASTVRIYTLDTPEIRGRNLPHDYVWKDPEPKSRFKFELLTLDRELGRFRRV